ncbi:hypothetical protein RN001_002946 [Aquatica leii]|uniref:Uncharacterized protein n=1 Tax=Aquatica leii TaxID=1421715 RepID=A0AAN7PE90_9COLE|nr:hypothetical protein RN001_002946 [Aquatica leii]
MLLSYCFILSLLIGHCLTKSSCRSNVTPKNVTFKKVIPDYYWREYLGVIPDDAFPGGSDKSGAHTYIGQMFTKGLLLPATIYQGSQTALASAGGISIRQENFVKILCTQSPGRYRWIPTENSKIHLLTDVHLVIGGTEAGYVLNIGRVNHEMNVVIGKIFADHTLHKGLKIPYNNQEITYQSYEVLVYRYPGYRLLFPNFDENINPFNINEIDKLKKMLANLHLQ